MISALRSASAILMGFITGFVIIAGCVYANSRLFPLPQGIDGEDSAAVNAAMGAMPAKAMILILVGWAIGTIGASFMAARFAGELKSLHGLLMGLIFLAGGIVTMRQIHRPLWFWIVGIAIFFPAAIIGSSLALPRESTNAAK
jgi:hypothetical protein